jgi:hypothetical protein
VDVDNGSVGLYGILRDALDEALAEALAAALDSVDRGVIPTVLLAFFNSGINVSLT